jgi:hypothetical protein
LEWLGKPANPVLIAGLLTGRCNVPPPRVHYIIPRLLRSWLQGLLLSWLQSRLHLALQSQLQSHLKLSYHSKERNGLLFSDDVWQTFNAFYTDVQHIILKRLNSTCSDSRIAQH